MLFICRHNCPMPSGEPTQKLDISYITSDQQEHARYRMITPRRMACDSSTQHNRFHGTIDSIFFLFFTGLCSASTVKQQCPHTSIAEHFNCAVESIVLCTGIVCLLDNSGIYVLPPPFRHWQVKYDITILQLYCSSSALAKRTRPTQWDCLDREVQKRS